MKRSSYTCSIDRLFNIFLKDSTEWNSNESEKFFFDKILYSRDVSFDFEDFNMTLLINVLN